MSLISRALSRAVIRAVARTDLRAVARADILTVPRADILSVTCTITHAVARAGILTVARAVVRAVVRAFADMFKARTERSRRRRSYCTAQCRSGVRRRTRRWPATHVF